MDCKRKLPYLIISAAACIVLCACGGGYATMPTEPPAATSKVTEAPAETPAEPAGTSKVTEAPAETPTEPADDMKLELSRTDISFDSVGVYYTLKVKHGIDPKDVEWITSDTEVCVVEDGVITITGPGLAKISAKYKGQEATCIVRVSVSEVMQLTEQERFEINIFLSNFSEQGFNKAEKNKFEAENADPAQLIKFAKQYNWINRMAKMMETMDDSGYLRLSLNQINADLDRFFGKNITSSEFQNSGFDVRGDMLYIPFAMGDTYNKLSIADRAEMYEDGTILVYFTVYRAGEAYSMVGGPIQDKSIYYWTPSQAADDSNLTECETGTALIVPYNHYGRSTYQLISYSLEGQS